MHLTFFASRVPGTRNGPSPQLIKGRSIELPEKRSIHARSFTRCRNAGAREATGELLFFVDADTVVPPRAVHAAVERFGAAPSAAGRSPFRRASAPLRRDSGAGGAAGVPPVAQVGTRLFPVLHARGVPF